MIIILLFKKFISNFHAWANLMIYEEKKNYVCIIISFQDLRWCCYAQIIERFKYLTSVIQRYSIVNTYDHSDTTEIITVIILKGNPMVFKES